MISFLPSAAIIFLEILLYLYFQHFYVQCVILLGKACYIYFQSDKLYSWTVKFCFIWIYGTVCYLWNLSSYIVLCIYFSLLCSCSFSYDFREQLLKYNKYTDKGTIWNVQPNELLPSWRTRIMSVWWSLCILYPTLHCVYFAKIFVGQYILMFHQP